MDSFSPEKLFLLSTISGFCFSLLLFLSTGSRIASSSRLLRLPFLSRLHLLSARLHHLAAKAPLAGKTTRLPLPAHAVAPGTTMRHDTPPSSAPVWAGAFLTVFGLVGLVAHVLVGIGGTGSLAVAGAGGVTASSLMVRWMGRYFGGNLEPVTSNVLIGTPGHVTVAIPPDGVGAIAYVADGKRVTMAARGEDGRAISQGRQIMVVDIRRHVAHVVELREP